jgi:hypothetical protein
MTPAVAQFTEHEEKDLNHYAQILKQYIDPEISQYSPIGGRKLPKTKRAEAERVSQERGSLQERLGIGWKWQYKGRWKLEMVGANETPGSQYCDEGYWWILPLNSERKKILEYLASEMLPKFFKGKKFVVNDTMVPCYGDCSWDIR